MKNMQRMPLIALCLLFLSCVGGKDVVETRAAEQDQESRIRNSIKDVKDEFENTRVIELCVYDRMRKALDMMVSESLRKGNLEAASAGVAILGVAPMTPLVLISFVEYIQDNEPFFFLKLFFNTAGFFDLEAVKISVDGQIIESSIIKKSSEKVAETKDNKKYYKQEYIVAADYTTFQQIDNSQTVKVKFYGSNDRAMIVEFDDMDKKYVRAFMEYVK